MSGDDNQYPDGKMSEDDEGAISVALGIKDGKVMIIYPKPVAWIAYPPEEAIAFGAAIIAKAQEVIKPVKH